MPNFNVVYDDALELIAEDTNIASAGNTTSATILDLGPAYVEGKLIIDVSVLDVASTDETYTFFLEGSNVAAMSSGSVALAMIQMGNNIAPNDSDTAIGRFAIPFHNEQNGTVYRYVRLYVVVAGTTPSITFSSFLTVG